MKASPLAHAHVLIAIVQVQGGYYRVVRRPLIIHYAVFSRSLINLFNCPDCIYQASLFNMFPTLFMFMPFPITH